jgi:3-hydroxybutyryl-CoA dehydrogenase
VGVVGSGTMATGIVEVFAKAGYDVLFVARGQEKVAAVQQAVVKSLEKAVQRDKITAEDRDQALAHVSGTTKLEDLRDVDLVVEAVIEELGLKQSIFRALDAETAPDAILATNTSALSVAAIASATARPERVLGLHFFNPVPLMALVEVVPTAVTSREVVDRATAIVTAWGKTPVRSADRPGFIVNRVNRPYTIEALRILEEGAASVTAIDAAMRAAGYAMGPFELMDLAGLDVNVAAATAVWDGLGRPERLRPSPIQARLVDAGRLGRKTEAGFYRYQDGRRAEIIDDMTSAGHETLAASEILGRIESAVAAEADRAVEDGVASPVDIATALRLGASYPEQAIERLGRYPAPHRAALRPTNPGGP